MVARPVVVLFSINLYTYVYIINVFGCLQWYLLWYFVVI